jgi:FeS assembly protein IscX
MPEAIKKMLDSSETFSPQEESDPLYWDDTYAISLRLKKAFPEINLQEVSLGMIYDWTMRLADFHDEPELANQEILEAIYQEWYEEVNQL